MPAPVFLSVWLCGWSIGEAFALWTLVKGGIALATGRPPDPGREPLVWGPAVLTGLFLVVWLAVWTLGGVAAIAALLRAVWAEDRIVVLGGRLAVTWWRGPVRFHRAFARDAIRRLLLTDREGALSLEVEGERVQLSSLGTRDERSGADRARVRLALPRAGAATLPRSWEEIVTPEGQRALIQEPRDAQDPGASAAESPSSSPSRCSPPRRRCTTRPPSFPRASLLALTSAMAAGVVWPIARREWHIGSGRLTLRKRFGSRVRDARGAPAGARRDVRQRRRRVVRALCAGRVRRCARAGRNPRRLAGPTEEPSNRGAAHERFPDGARPRSLAVDGIGN
jgi:hypothetical protein